MGTASTTERIREIGADIESRSSHSGASCTSIPELSGKETRTQFCIELGKLGVGIAVQLGRA